MYLLYSTKRVCLIPVGIVNVVFIPKRRQKLLYGSIRKYLGETFHDLAKCKGIVIEEGKGISTVNISGRVVIFCLQLDWMKR